MRIVVKIGTSTLAHPGGRLNIRHTEALVKVWSDIKNAGHELIIVSSGATGLGVGKLQISRPKDMVTKQAAAAVGQCELMYTYDKLFAEYSHTVAQLLVTWEDFDHPHRLNNLQNTLERLIQLGAVPVINENDPISTEEYSLGDNDRLGALIAKYTHADLLVLLSDIDGLYTADPHTHPEATLIHRVESVTPEIEQLGGGSNSGLGLGIELAKVERRGLDLLGGFDLDGAERVGIQDFPSLRITVNTVKHSSDFGWDFIQFHDCSPVFLCLLAGFAFPLQAWRTSLGRKSHLVQR